MVYTKIYKLKESHRGTSLEWLTRAAAQLQWYIQRFTNKRNCTEERLWNGNRTAIGGFKLILLDGKLVIVDTDILLLFVSLFE